MKTTTCIYCGKPIKAASAKIINNTPTGHNIEQIGNAHIKCAKEHRVQDGFVEGIAEFGYDEIPVTLPDPRTARA